MNKRKVIKNFGGEKTLFSEKVEFFPGKVGFFQKCKFDMGFSGFFQWPV